jgi:hypothetical protein
MKGIKFRDEHYLAVLLQIHNRQFQNTTDKFKGKTLRTLYEYNPALVLENMALYRLYYEFGHSWWIEYNRN